MFGFSYFLLRIFSNLDFLLVLARRYHHLFKMELWIWVLLLAAAANGVIGQNKENSGMISLMYVPVKVFCPIKNEKLK